MNEQRRTPKSGFEQAVVNSALFIMQSLNMFGTDTLNKFNLLEQAQKALNKGDIIWRSKEKKYYGTVSGLNTTNDVRQVIVYVEKLREKGDDTDYGIGVWPYLAIIKMTDDEKKKNKIT
jgi:hypothetical protein